MAFLNEASPRNSCALALQIAPLLSRGGSALGAASSVSLAPSGAPDSDCNSPAAPLPPGNGDVLDPAFEERDQPRASHSAQGGMAGGLQGRAGGPGDTAHGRVPLARHHHPQLLCSLTALFMCLLCHGGNTIFSVGLTDLLIVCDVSNSSSINLILRIYGANIPAPY